MLSQNILLALKTFYQIIDGKNILWVLSGSTSLVLQGVDVVINNDIDILTDAEGSKQINILLADRKIKESEYSATPKYRSYFGVYKFGDVNIEVMGEFQYRLKNGLWSKPNQTNKILIKEFQGMFLPVLTLEQEMEEYDNIGRIGKVEKIRAALN